MRRWLIVVVVGMSFLLVLVLWHQSQRSQYKPHQQFIVAARIGKDPEAVVRAFLWALSVGDYNLAHELLDKSSRKKVTPCQLASLNRFAQISQILSVRVKVTGNNQALADFALTLKGLDAPTADFIREYVTLRPSRRTVVKPIPKIPLISDFWRMFRTFIFPTYFDTAPKGWLIQFGSDGKTTRIYAIDANYQDKRKKSYPFTSHPFFFLRRYELIRENGKWRISNAVGP